MIFDFWCLKVYIKVNRATVWSSAHYFCVFAMWMYCGLLLFTGNYYLFTACTPKLIRADPRIVSPAFKLIQPACSKKKSKFSGNCSFLECSEQYLNLTVLLSTSCNACLEFLRNCLFTVGIVQQFWLSLSRIILDTNGLCCSADIIYRTVTSP